MSDRRLGRRAFLKVAASLTYAGLIAACDSPPAPNAGEKVADSGTEEPAKEKVEVHCHLGELHPTEWTTRSADRPLTGNAARILARRFEELNPEIAIVFDNAGDDGWLTAAVSTGLAPDLISRFGLVQRGWCVHIDDWLLAPSRYAPHSDTWSDTFFPSMMESLIWHDGFQYSAPLHANWPFIEIGLACNIDSLNEMVLHPPSTWAELKEVSLALKDAGLGLSPWPRESQNGDCWPLALQILPPMMQEICADIDANADLAIDSEEALHAYRNDLIGPYTPIYRRAWDEMYALAQTWLDGFETADLELLWREGSAVLQYRSPKEFATLAQDPSIEFEHKFVPSPVPSSADIPAMDQTPGALDPYAYTAGDGNVPGEFVKAVRGPQDVMISTSTQLRNNREQVVNWWQFITEPENNSFLNNENQLFIPSAKDGKLGPLWSGIAEFKLPLYSYKITWGGMGLLWDMDYFAEWRRIFLAWVIGEMNRDEFFERQQRSWNEGVGRYEALLAGNEDDS